MRITPRKPSRAGDRHLQFQELIVRFEVPIRNWPIRPDAVTGVDFKVRRMKTGSESCPVHGSASNAFAAVVGTESERIFSAGNAEIFPIKLMRAGLVADPIALCVPEWTGFHPDNFEARAGESLKQHSTRRADPDDEVIDLLIFRIPPHRKIDDLHRSEAMEMLTVTREKRAANRCFQWVPPCPCGGFSRCVAISGSFGSETASTGASHS